MRVDLLTREYPPHVYGGAGAHVTNLVQHLRPALDLRVHCFGEERPDNYVAAYQATPSLDSANMALQTVSVNSAMAAAVRGASVVHSHTWYANFGGYLAKTLHGVPHVVTAHTLEPLRPWKVEQLSNGYALSTFLERTALLDADRIIAVSQAMRDDILRCYPEVDPSRITVIRNGVDPHQYAPTADTGLLRQHGVRSDRTLVVTVARITPHKGLPHLLRAAEHLEDHAQLVIVADNADSPQHRRDFAEQVRLARERGVDVLWISEVIDRNVLAQLLTRARVFVCPSLYEPLGIVNLEAMACGTAVVATETGGIPEVVVDGSTGLLVPIGADDLVDGRLADPDGFEKGLAMRVNELLGNEELARALGEAGRRRAVTRFSWATAARQVHDVYTAVAK